MGRTSDPVCLHAGTRQEWGPPIRSKLCAVLRFIGRCAACETEQRVGCACAIVWRPRHHSTPLGASSPCIASNSATPDEIPPGPERRQPQTTPICRPPIIFSFQRLLSTCLQSGLLYHDRIESADHDPVQRFSYTNGHSLGTLAGSSRVARDLSLVELCLKEILGQSEGATLDYGTCTSFGVAPRLKKENRELASAPPGHFESVHAPSTAYLVPGFRLVRYAVLMPSLL